MSIVDRGRRLVRWLAAIRLDRSLGIPPGHIARRAAASSVYVGGGVVLARVLGRHALYLPARDTSLVPGLLFHGTWEKWVTRVLAQHLRPGMVVGDVGANVGYFTVMMADRVGAAGHVHAFEANADLAALVERSLFVGGHAGYATVHPVALGEEEGREMLLCLPGDALGGGAIAPVVDHEVPNSRRVAIRRLDAMPGADRIELLKIDAEGSEPAIWEGMAGLIAGPTLRTVLLEFVAGSYDDPAAFLDRIAAAGFAMRLIDHREGVRPVTRDWLLAPAQHVATLMLLLTR